MVSRPRPIFIAEAIAVFGIFSLYALEFAGVHTFSQLLPDQGETSVQTFSFISTAGTDVFISVGTALIMAIVAFLAILYFGFLRKKYVVKN